MNKTYNSAYLYILLLLGITLFLYLTQYVIVKYNLHIKHNIYNPQPLSLHFHFYMQLILKKYYQIY